MYNIKIKKIMFSVISLFIVVTFISGCNSPFNKKLYFIKNATASGVTTDYFKYIVLIRNSPGTTIYNIK